MASQPEERSESGRRIERQPVSANVQFRAGTRRANVTVCDITKFGARIAGVFLVREDDHFFLKLPMLEPIEAHVVWVNDFEFGCEFERPLNDFVLEAALRHI